MIDFLKSLSSTIAGIGMPNKTVAFFRLLARCFHIYNALAILAAHEGLAFAKYLACGLSCPCERLADRKEQDRVNDSLNSGT